VAIVPQDPDFNMLTAWATAAGADRRGYPILQVDEFSRR
jgi:hypothetical protein